MHRHNMLHSNSSGDFNRRPHSSSSFNNSHHHHHHHQQQHRFGGYGGPGSHGAGPGAETAGERCSVHFSGVPVSTDETLVRKLFGGVGHVLGFRIHGPEPGRDTRYGVVDYSDDTTANEAVKRLSNYRFGDAAMTVSRTAPRNLGAPAFRGRGRGRGFSGSFEGSAESSFDRGGFARGGRGLRGGFSSGSLEGFGDGRGGRGRGRGGVAFSGERGGRGYAHGRGSSFLVRGAAMAGRGRGMRGGRGAVGVGAVRDRRQMEGGGRGLGGGSSFSGGMRGQSRSLTPSASHGSFAGVNSGAALGAARFASAYQRARFERRPDGRRPQDLMRFPPTFTDPVLGGNVHGSPVLRALAAAPYTDCYAAVEQLRELAVDSPDIARTLLVENPVLATAVVCILQHARKLRRGRLPPVAFGRGGDDFIEEEEEEADETANAAAATEAAEEHGGNDDGGAYANEEVEVEEGDGFPVPMDVVPKDGAEDDATNDLNEEEVEDGEGRRGTEAAASSSSSSGGGGGGGGGLSGARTEEVMRIVESLSEADVERIAGMSDATLAGIPDPNQRRQLQLLRDCLLELAKDA